MANKITTRDDFKQYCLRKLGSPVININVDHTQVDDRVEEALQIYQEKHYDATENQWIYYELTQSDIDNDYITLPDDIMVVISILPLNALVSQDGMFSYQYQLALSELSPWRPLNKIDYFMKMSDFQDTINMISVENSFEFTRHKNKLKIYVEMDKYYVGYRVCMNIQRVIDPDTNSEVWNDKWLKQYTTALIKQQWGENMKKFAGVQMLGGVELNGQQLFDEATQELQDLEQQLEQQYMEPIGFLMG